MNAIVEIARSGNYHKARCDEGAGSKDYCECTDDLIALMADEIVRLEALLSEAA